MAALRFGRTLAGLRWLRRRAGTVAGFPLRCMHCASPLRLAVGSHPSGPIYASPDGHYACPGKDRPIRHKPMPIIGGSRA